MERVSLGYPLDGVRVLDMSRVLAGPYVGRMLADLGADVVKVEPPEGDVTRFWGKDVAGLSGYYTQQNVGKRNICIDLRAGGGGPELVRELAGRADILLENFRPGVMAQYGLSFESLSQSAPQLIMLSISGFGQSGPESRRAAYASVVHAESGVVDRLRPKSGPFTEPRVSFADMNAGLHGLVGVLSALYMRERTGRGQHIDIAMLDTMLATDDYVHMSLDELPQPHGIASDVWDSSAGPMVIAGDPRWIWRRLSEVHGIRDNLPEEASLRDKITARHGEITRFLKSFERSEDLFDALGKAGLAFGCVKDTATALQSPTVQHRRSVAEVSDRAGGTRRVIQSPYRFSHAQSGARSSGAPHRGEHNAQILTEWLGSDAGRASTLSAQGVLLAEMPNGEVPPS